MPEVNIIADVEVVFVFEKHSVDITPAIWHELASTIYNRLGSVDGFVVLHGLDNLLFTASVLSFLIQNINRPVIFTGNVFDIADSKKLETRANLINAIQAATFELPEVCLMFGNRLLRATQAKQSSEKSLNVFESPENAVVGRIDFSIRIFDKMVFHTKGKPKLSKELIDSVAVIYPNSTLTAQDIAEQTKNVRGIIVNANHLQKLPAILLSSLLQQTAVPVVVWAPHIGTSTTLPSHIALVHNMTWPATFTKALWAFTNFAPDQIAHIVADNTAGEIIE